MLRTLRGLGWLAIMAAFTVPAWATVHNVTVQNFSFTPQNITVTVGDTVVWTNVGGFHSVHHNATPSLFGNSIGSGWTYTFVFNLPTTRYDYICQQHPTSMSGSVTVVPPSAVGERPSEMVKDFSLEQNYPNPFNSRTTIQFNLSAENHVSLRLLNVLGQDVQTIFSGHLSAGAHQINFDAQGLSGGIYYYQLATPAATITRKMVYLK